MLSPHAAATGFLVADRRIATKLMKQEVQIDEMILISKKTSELQHLSKKLDTNILSMFYFDKVIF